MSSMIIVETDRLVLRSLVETDSEVMYDYRNNEKCARYQRNQTISLEGIKNLIKEHKGDELGVDDNTIFAVALKATGEMIGEVVVMPVENTISLGYTFSYKVHRQGYAHEVLSSFIDLLHREYPDFEFISFTNRENLASIALLEKLGYDYLGYSENKNSVVFGKWINSNPFDDV